MRRSLRKALRRIRHPFKGRPLTAFAAGMIALVIAVIAVYLGFTKSIPFQHQFTIKAVFQSANELKTKSFVRIAGVNVGEVQKVEHLRPGSEGAVVTMQIMPMGLPIHSDATAKIRPRIFLEGNFFVDLFPGSPTAPVLHDGGEIPVKQTATPVQIDQILGALKSNTRQELVTLLANLATAVQGNGATGYNRSVVFQKPANQYGAIVARALQGKNPHDLSGFIGASGLVSKSLDSNPPALKGLVTDFDTTAAAFARQQSNLRQAVGELPVTLGAARPALSALNNSFPHVQRLTADLRPAIATTIPMIDATEPLLAQLNGLVSPPELRGLVADLRPTIPALARLNGLLPGLLGQVRLASSCQNQVVLPWTHLRISDPNFPSTGPVYQEAVRILPNLTGESRSGDANGQWFRVLATGGNNIVQSAGLSSAAPGVVGVNPQKPVRNGNPAAILRPPLRPNVPCETQKVPDLRSVPSSVSPGKSTSATDTRGAALRTLEILRAANGAKAFKQMLAKQGVTAKTLTQAGISPAEAAKLLGAPASGAKPPARPAAPAQPRSGAQPTPRAGASGAGSPRPGLLAPLLAPNRGAGR